MTAAVNIILPTIRFLPVTRDIIYHLIGAVEDAEDIHLTIADGQEDDHKKEIILARAERLAKDGKFTYIGLKDPTQRVFLAAQLETEWILPLSDDDPYSVNLIRGAYDMSRTVSSDTMAITPYAYLYYLPTQFNLFRLQDIDEEQQGVRLLSLYRQAHLNGILTWSMIRRKPFLEWLEFLRTKTICPTYADQLLVSYLAMKGKIIASKEKSFYGKDDWDWYPQQRAIIKDSGSYPNAFLALFHEIFWISDLYTFLGSNGLEDAAVPSLTFRATALLAGCASAFEPRRRVLEIEKSCASEEAYSLIVNLASYAKALDKARVEEHVRFFMQVQSVSQTLTTEKREEKSHDHTGMYRTSSDRDTSVAQPSDISDLEEKQVRESSQPVRSVLIVCTHFPPSVGGLETITAQLGTSLIAKGYDVHVATERSEKRAFKEYCGITIHSLDPVPLPEQRLPLAVQQLRELILSGRYDACILLADPRNWIFWSLEGLEVPEHTRIIAQPLINAEGFARWCDNSDFRDRLTQILKRVDSVVAISTGGVIVQYLTEEGIPYVYIPNAVEREKGSDDFRARYGIPESVPVLLHIANLWPVKNHLGLMDTLSTIGGDWRLVMIGHSSGDSRYEQQVRDAVQRDPRFMLIPGLPRHDVAAALDTADILLLASHGEVAPVTVLEAMSHAKPWLATPQCGGVHDNAGGLIAPIEQFPQVLSWLLKDRQTLDRLGQAGYRHWSECFGWDTVISAWDSLIQTGVSSGTFEIPAPISEEMQRIRDGIPQSLRGGFTTPAPASAVDTPLVSVIIPTCNRLASVRTALDSIVGQTHPNLEIIIVNDGEVDLQELVNAYRPQRPVTYVVHDRNRGTGASRNTGLKLARGKYIAYLDDDDRYLPEHIAVLASALEAHPDHVAAYSLATEVTRIERDGRCEPLRRQVTYNRPFDAHQMLVANYIPNLCLMHRRSACEKIGGHDERLAMLEDWEFLIRLSRIGEFVHIQKVTAEYYVNIGSSHRNRVGEQAISITRAIYERYVDHAIPAVRQAQQSYLDRLSAVVRRPDGNPQASVGVEEVAALVHQAEQYITEGDLAAAQQRLNQVLEIRPGEPQLIVMLGNVLLRLGDIEAARREFTKATILHPQCAPAHADLAAVLLHLGCTAEAETSARKTIELDPTNVSALKVLGRICLDTERYQEAVQAYATILQYDPNDIETLILVGNCYAEVGRPEEAKAFYCRVLQLDPGHAVAVENLAVVSGQQPSSTPTSPVVEETIESEPIYVSTDVSDGRMPRTRVEASSDVSSIREETASPRSSSVDKVTEVLQRVETHMKNEDLDAASRVLTEAVAQAPDNPDLIVASGHVAWKQGDLEKARLQFVRAVALKPNHVQAHAALAVLFLQQRRFAEAEEAARKALAIDAAEVTALKVVAKICLDTERYQEAVQSYATILRHVPDDIETLILVGNCYAESGRFEQARSFYRKVLALDPGNAVAKDNLMLLGGKEPASDACELRDANPETPLTPYPLPLPPSASRLTSIIIVTYNSASTIRACLDSVLGESRSATEVIVVDNLSIDETRSILGEYQGRIATILNPDNVGFSAACNKGIRASTGEYIVLLNPDTVVTSVWLDRLIAHIGPSVGAVGPVSDHAAGMQNIDRHLPDGAPRRMGLAEVTDLLGRANHGKARETKLLTGFCLMVPRRVLDDVGLLDESLFLGNDDLDLSWRLRLKGYKLLVATDTFVHHKGQVSFKSEAKTKTSRLVQESTDRLYAKLVAHYGPGNVPSPMELWDIDWFRPSPLPPHPSRLTSIIILTHNGLEHTRQCLASIEAHTPEPHELIIVDNGSTDGTLDYLRDYTADHDNVRVVANRTNRGFAAGNNQGLAVARGDYLLLLNNDTIVTEGWLTRMLQVMKMHPDVGVVGPMSNYVSGPQLVRGVSYEGLEGLDAFAARWAQSHDGQSREATRVVGFCLLTRKEVIARIGGLDEQFGSGNFEDDDFCIRAFQVGFLARIALDAFVHHTGSQTFKTAKIDYRQSLMRNWELFKRKWNIPADAPYEKGYRFPPPSAENVTLSVSLPDVGADHRCGGDGRWWHEIGEDRGRCEPAVTAVATALDTYVHCDQPAAACRD